MLRLFRNRPARPDSVPEWYSTRLRRDIGMPEIDTISHDVVRHLANVRGWL